jgi:hypothetical protein
MIKRSTLHIAIAAFALLLVTSSTGFAQELRRITDEWSPSTNYRSTIPITTRRRATSTRETRATSTPEWRQGTTQDQINAQYQRYQRQYQRPLDYPDSAEMARQDILRQRAERAVRGNRYRPSRRRAAVNAVLTLFGVGN